MAELEHLNAFLVNQNLKLTPFAGESKNEVQAIIKGLKVQIDNHNSLKHNKSSPKNCLRIERISHHVKSPAGPLCGLSNTEVKETLAARLTLTSQTSA